MFTYIHTLLPHSSHHPLDLSSTTHHTTHIKMAANSQPNSQASTNYKEAFSLFDKRGNGRVTIDSLGDLLRACGQNPTLSEIEDLKRQAGGNDCKYPLPSLPSHHTFKQHKF
jgi:hypothetical protein